MFVTIVLSQKFKINIHVKRGIDFSCAISFCLYNPSDLRCGNVLIGPPFLDNHYKIVIVNIIDVHTCSQALSCVVLVAEVVLIPGERQAVLEGVLVLHA